jgi:hypothetical protein
MDLQDTDATHLEGISNFDLNMVDLIGCIDAEGTTVESWPLCIDSTHVLFRCSRSDGSTEQGILTDPSSSQMDLQDTDATHLEGISNFDLNMVVNPSVKTMDR